MRVHKMVLPALLTLAGCSSPDRHAGSGAADRSTAEPAVAPAATTPPRDGASPAAIKIVLPQIAYTYRYEFRLSAAAVATVQQRHLALCDRLGPARCHVISMDRTTIGPDGAISGGSLKLAVEAGLARAFGERLAATAAQAGGTQGASSIAAEDLSKQIVDTEARLRAKQALAERLMEVLRTRNGPVADLVAAERAVADVEEEIDAARSWLAEARGRVAMSTFELGYVSDGQAGLFRPLRESLSSMGGLFTGSLGVLAIALAVVLPWAVLGGLVYLGVRMLRRRRQDG